MAEYVELIGKYIVTRDESGTPSYSWTDNTGEIVRCRECKNWNQNDIFGWSRLGNYRCKCEEWSTEVEGEKPIIFYTSPDGFCFYGKRKGGDAE